MDTILSETVRVSKLSVQELRAELPAGWIIPPMIPIGSRTIWTSAQAMDAINKLSETYRRQWAKKYTVSRDSFQSCMMHAIGEMIVEIRSVPQNQANWLQHAINILDGSLRKRLSNTAIDLTEIVSCDVFDEDQQAPAFSIGPVNFVPRLEWLRSQPEVMRTVINRVWAGQLQLDNLESIGQSEGIAKIDLFHAMELVRHIGVHLWVAAVPFKGHDVKQAHIKGPLFVELALDFLSLFFSTDRGRQLLHPGIQSRLSETSISLDKAGKAFSGWKFNKPGVGGPPGMAQKLLQDGRDLLDAAGVILSRYSADSDAGKISRLIDRWINALHWCGTAMRHDLDFMALADYGDALDILSCAGGNTGEMINYCATALSVDKQYQIAKDGSSLETVINQIYNLGRSAIRHGNLFGLMAEYGRERARAHEMTREVLLNVTMPLADIVRENNRMLTLDKDEVRAFLSVLSNRHSKTDT